MPHASVVERTNEMTRLERVLGDASTGRPGPVIVVTAGLHGNEPAGTVALGRVFAAISEHGLPLRGRLLGLAGNVSALAMNQRFVARDLNRGWTSDRIAELLGRDAREDKDEDAEQRALLEAFKTPLATAKQPVVFLDLHSTSAGGSPFTIIADTLRNRRIAFALPAPVILGLEETIDGTMSSFLDDLGHVAIVFEGGQNQDPRTIDNHEAAVWITLERAGALSAAEIPDFARKVEALSAVTRGIPRVVEIRGRHAITPEDRFEMQPGYSNFQSIHRGEVLAHDQRGDVCAWENGLILMPLYQKQGDDGFFAARGVRRAWLVLSRVLRVLRADRLLPLLPGVSRHPTHDDRLVADPDVARFVVHEIFHLFGYRKMKREGGKHVFSRRRPEFRGWSGIA